MPKKKSEETLHAAEEAALTANNQSETATPPDGVLSPPEETAPDLVADAAPDAKTPESTPTGQLEEGDTSEKGKKSARTRKTAKDDVEKAVEETVRSVENPEEDPVDADSAEAPCTAMLEDSIGDAVPIGEDELPDVSIAEAGIFDPTPVPQQESVMANATTEEEGDGPQRKPAEDILSEEEDWTGGTAALPVEQADGPAASSVTSDYHAPVFPAPDLPPLDLPSAQEVFAPDTVERFDGAGTEEEVPAASRKTPPRRRGRTAEANAAEAENTEADPPGNTVPIRKGRQVSGDHPPSFFDLDYNALDRNLTQRERQEWNSIYASYRSRSILTGTVIGRDDHIFMIRNKKTGVMERRVVHCAIVISYRVKVLIPETDLWFSAEERQPDFVLRNMAGAVIDYVILQVDRPGGVAIASRRMAMGARRYQFSRLTGLHRPDALTTCRVLVVGPRRCLVECHGFDIGLTQREMRYSAIPDMRKEYHSGDELDCRIKHYDPDRGELQISIKEVEAHPFEGAELRHPVGSWRQAVIAGKYAGGVFCNLPDGTVCMSLYSARHDDADFQVGDRVMIVIRQYDNDKRQIYGKIVSKW